MDLYFLLFIQSLQTLSPEMVSVILFGICTLSILLLLRRLGEQGLYLYNIVAILASNIQVLKGVQFSMSAEPVALGTFLFSTTYLCSDILAEHYGKDSAKRGVWLAFYAQILMTLFMMIAVGYPPLTSTAVGSAGTEHMPLTEQAMAILFTPSPRILFASLLAFLISQFIDIRIYQALSKLTQQRALWFRTLVSTLCSAIIDTLLFSVLAWVILAPNPISLSVFTFTYVLGTLAMRAIVRIASIPIMYFSKSFAPNSLRSLTSSSVSSISNPLSKSSASNNSGSFG
jgi:uncharacterized integral membrane protein (TIGR00697 family)